MESKHPAKLLSLVLNKLQNIPSLTVQIHTGNSNTGAGKIPFGQGHLLQQWPEALHINYSKHKHSVFWGFSYLTAQTPHTGLFSPQRERLKPWFLRARLVELSLTLLGSWNESSPVVRGEEHKGVLTDAQLLQVLQDFPNAVINLPHSIPIPEAKGDAKHSEQQEQGQHNVQWIEFVAVLQKSFSCIRFPAATANLCVSGLQRAAPLGYWGSGFAQLWATLGQRNSAIKFTKRGKPTVPQTGR